MKRTTSGSDLSHENLSVTVTPYVHMSAHLADTPLDASDPSAFRRRCGGATIRQLHMSGATTVTMPPEVDVVVADGFLSATYGFDRAALFSRPLTSIIRAECERKSSADAFCSLLFGCCFGREVVLALDLDAPVGWLHWEMWSGKGIVGPVRLSLFVLPDDVDEMLDAMGVALV